MTNEEEVITLFRPVGARELELIRETGWHNFPARLTGQPFFYPVLNETYATQIAKDWNATHGETGYVLRFQVSAHFLASYPIRTVGSSIHREYWIPAEDLAEFNRHIVGPIEVIAVYRSERD